MKSSESSMQPDPAIEDGAEPDRTVQIDWRTSLIWSGMPPAVATLALAGLTDRPEFERILQIADSKFLPAWTFTMHGSNGNGKTHMASYLFSNIYARYYFATARSERMVHVLWTEANRITAALKDFRRGDFQYDHEMQVYTLPHLLLIDDLFADGASEFDVRNLVEVIDRRISAKRFTIITTNISPMQIHEQYSPRLADRMRGGEVIAFTGASHRGMRPR